MNYYPCTKCNDIAPSKDRLRQGKKTFRCVKCKDNKYHEGMCYLCVTPTLNRPKYNDYKVYCDDCQNGNIQQKCIDCNTIYRKNNLINNSCSKCDDLLVECHLCNQKYKKYDNNKQINRHVGFNCIADKLYNCIDCNVLYRNYQLIKGSCINCDNTKITCDKCNLSYPKYKDSSKTLTLHINFNCDKDQVQCTKCYDTVDRINMNNHCQDDKTVTMSMLSRIITEQNNKHNKNLDYVYTELLRKDEIIENMHDIIKILEEKNNSLMRKIKRRQLIVGTPWRRRLPYGGNGSPEDTEYSDHDGLVHDSSNSD